MYKLGATSCQNREVKSDTFLKAVKHTMHFENVEQKTIWGSVDVQSQIEDQIFDSLHLASYANQRRSSCWINCNIKNTFTISISS